MPIELGYYMYLFESPKGGENCLISAHGGYLKNIGTFDITKISTDVKVLFYGEHNKILSDPGLEVLSRRPLVVNSHPNPDGKDVPDYNLTKYQGRHSEGIETYGKIEKTLAEAAVLGARLELELDMIMSRPHSKKIYESLAYCHVVTIRNRNVKANVSLKHAVQMIVKKRPQIKKIHCSFCRSLVGDANAQTSAVKERQD